MGSEKSGNRRPINRIPIFATVEMLDLLRSLPNKKGLPYRNLIMKDFLEAHKEEFIALNGEESFNEHLEKYNLNTTEMRLRKNEREKEADKKREERLKLKLEELDLRRRELDLREKNSDMRNEEKIEEREEEELLEKSRKQKEIEDVEKELSFAKSRLKNASRGAFNFGKTPKEQVVNDLQIEITTLEKKLAELEQ